jgi:uncharacterized protein (DUF1501 family)
LVAKLGGNAKVFTRAQLRHFRTHFARKSPMAFIRYRGQIALRHKIEPAVRRIAHATGLFPTIKALRRAVMGGPARPV